MSEIVPGGENLAGRDGKPSASPGGEILEPVLVPEMRPSPRIEAALSNPKFVNRDVELNGGNGPVGTIGGADRFDAGQVANERFAATSNVSSAGFQDGLLGSAGNSSPAEELQMISLTLESVSVEAEPELMEAIDTIPDKMAFKIGEVAEMVGVKQYVLRYWESEFDQLHPKKSKNNQRFYTRKDVETALMIRKLLYDDRFSIEGARVALKNLKSQVKQEKSFRSIAKTQGLAVQRLEDLVRDIQKLREAISNGP